MSDKRICRCDECEAWATPGCPAEGKIWWRGRWYGIDVFWSNYYSAKDPDNSRHLLHREIYMAHVGPIPDGYIVHHVDHDKYNNQPENLVAISKSDHAKEEGHGRDKLRAYVESHTPEEWGQRSKDLVWSKRKPRDVACAECGEVFQSTGMRAKFCGSRCSDRDRYRRRKQTPTV